MWNAEQQKMVFILGAGFSAYAKYPLVKGLRKASCFAPTTDEPIHAPAEERQPETEIDWLPLRTLHSDRQERVKKKRHGSKSPGPAA